jgi:hypothetical protein
MWAAVQKKITDAAAYKESLKAVFRKPVSYFGDIFWNAKHR